MIACVYTMYQIDKHQNSPRTCCYPQNLCNKWLFYNQSDEKKKQNKKNRNHSKLNITMNFMLSVCKRLAASACVLMEPIYIAYLNSDFMQVDMSRLNRLRIIYRKYTFCILITWLVLLSKVTFKWSRTNLKHRVGQLRIKCLKLKGWLCSGPSMNLNSLN